MTPRRILFWLHLAVGSTVGIAVAFLAITGSILSLQPWFERANQIQGEAPGCYAPPSAMLNSAGATVRQSPTAVTIYRDLGRPSEVAYGESAVLVNGCTGAVAGGRAARVHSFFLKVRDLHRWIAWGGIRHENLRAVKNACNLGFLFLILSGIVLWLPRKWSRKHVASATLLRRGFAGRARDWNLHTVIGFWMTLPLLCIVVTGAIMAYPWANALLFRVAGSPPPPPKTEGERKPHKPLHADAFGSLDGAMHQAMMQDARWQSITMRIPTEKDAVVNLTIDEGDGGRPQDRSQLDVRRADGVVMRYEPFSANSRGRRWRMYARFLHTGELFGIAGQTGALVVVLSTLLLVWTGFALALRRLFGWVKRDQLRQSERAIEVAS